MTIHHRIRIAAAAIAVSLALCVAQGARAQDHVPKATAWAQKTLKGWMADPVVIDAIKAQNAKHAALAQDKIAAMDKQWRGDTTEGRKRARKRGEEKEED